VLASAFSLAAGEAGEVASTSPIGRARMIACHGLSSKSTPGSHATCEPLRTRILTSPYPMYFVRVRPGQGRTGRRSDRSTA
jgi:hypothetical protein